MRPRTKVVSLATTSALLIGGAVFLPQAFAETKTASMNLACQAVPAKYAGPQNFPEQTPIDVNVNVSSPESVKVGEEFDTTFSIDPVNVPLPSDLPFGAKITDAWRMKLDFQLPDGAEYISGEVDESKANLKGFTIIRVNESGTPDSQGRILRLVDKGNQTIGNGPNSNPTNPGGVQYSISGTELNLTFPKITVRTKPTQAGELKFGVRTAGNAGNYAQDENFLTMGASIKAKVVFATVNITATVKCSPRPLANADSPLDERATRLAVVKVVAEESAQDSSLSLSAAPQAIAGRPTELTATVSPENAAGTVVFTSGSMTSAAIPVENGVAKTQMTFPESGSYPVTAAFTPADTTKFNSSTAEINVNVDGQEPRLEIDAPDTIDAAEGAVKVTAKVNPLAEGTVEFSLADGSVVTQKVANGQATASLPLGEALGTAELKAVFKPSSGSAFKGATATRNVEIKAAPKTSMTLLAPEQATVGQPTTVIAQLVPTEGTTEAKGSVTFTYAGGEKKVDVQDNKAAIELTPQEAGELAISAEYTPADASQSSVTANATIAVSKQEIIQENVSMQVDLPASVDKGKSVDAVVTVSPAEAAGKVSALVEGSKVEADVINGSASLPLTFNETGAQKVTFTFTPADTEKFAGTTNTADITVIAPGEEMPENPGSEETPGDGTPGENPGEQTPDIPKEVNDVIITPGETVGGEVILGEVEGKTASVTVKDSDGKGVFGTLKVLVDGKPAQLSGKDAHINVVGGKAKWTMDVFDAGKHIVTLQFFDTTGVLKGSKNVEMTVKNVEVDPRNISS